MQVPLSSPDITQTEIELVNQVLQSRFLSIGPKIEQFEREFAAYIGTKYAVAVNSGTSGLHLCMSSIGLGSGDEVVTTPFSFIASSNCILYEKGTPVFVDIDPATLNMDAELMEKAITPKTKAILPVHVFGNPCEMDSVIRIADKHELAVVEDACEAIGAEYRGRKVGTYGKASVFAFYPNKQITTGEGGVVATDDERITRLCRSLRNQGRSDTPGWLLHERLGYNYRLDEMSAALGLAQLSRIEEILGKRADVAGKYTERLSKIGGIEVPLAQPHVKTSWFVYVVRLTQPVDRDGVMSQLQEDGVGCSAYFPPIHLQPFYRKRFGYKEGDFPVCENISKSTLALPFHTNLKDEEIEYVCDKLQQALR